MTPIWILLQIVAGFLMSFAQAFRAGNFEFLPSWWNLILASIGIAVFMKVSSLRSSAKSRFFLGWWGAFIYFLVVLYWISIALKTFGELPLALSLLSTALLAGYCALFFGLWSLICGWAYIRSKPIFFRIAIWASLWAGLEGLREHLFTGFSWGELGYHFAFWPSIGRSASIWGVHGLTFLWIVSVSLLLHIDEWMRSRRAQIGVGLLVVLAISGSLYGHFSKRAEVPTETLKVALVQPNVDQGMKWNPKRASQQLEDLIELTRKAITQKPALIVWPETSYPFLVGLGQRQLPFSSSTPLLIGAVVTDNHNNYNSALLVTSDQIQKRFDKIHLVPFGEYVPFEEWMPFEKLVANAGRFRSGEKSQPPLEIPDTNLKIGPLICYEDAFSRHSVRHARRGANLLVNLTNDAWYGESSALMQHTGMAMIQHYQTGLPMLRATNTGITIKIDIKGYEQLKAGTQDIFITEIEVPTEKYESFFVKSYPLMEWIWFIIFAIALVWKSKFQKRRIFFPS